MTNENSVILPIPDIYQAGKYAGALTNYDPVVFGERGDPGYHYGSVQERVAASFDNGFDPVGWDPDTNTWALDFGPRASNPVLVIRPNSPDPTIPINEQAIVIDFVTGTIAGLPEFVQTFLPPEILTEHQAKVVGNVLTWAFEIPEVLAGYESGGISGGLRELAGAAGSWGGGWAGGIGAAALVNGLTGGAGSVATPYAVLVGRIAGGVKGESIAEWAWDNTFGDSNYVGSDHKVFDAYDPVTGVYSRTTSSVYTNFVELPTQSTYGTYVGNAIFTTEDYFPAGYRLEFEEFAEGGFSKYGRVILPGNVPMILHSPDGDEYVTYSDAETLKLNESNVSGVTFLSQAVMISDTINTPTGREHTLGSYKVLKVGEETTFAEDDSEFADFLFDLPQSLRNGGANGEVNPGGSSFVLLPESAQVSLPGTSENLSEHHLVSVVTDAGSQYEFAIGDPDDIHEDENLAALVLPRSDLPPLTGPV